MRIEQKRTGWLEPMAEWIKEAGNLPKIAQESNLFEKKVACRTLFGSNLVLAERKARISAPESGAVAPQNQWAALCAAHDLALKKTKSHVFLSSEMQHPYVLWIIPYTCLCSSSICNLFRYVFFVCGSLYSSSYIFCVSSPARFTLMFTPARLSSRSNSFHIV